MKPSIRVPMQGATRYERWHMGNWGFGWKAFYLSRRVVFSWGWIAMFRGGRQKFRYEHKRGRTIRVGLWLGPLQGILLEIIYARKVAK